MKILLADDHALIREGLGHVLRRLDGDAVIVDAANCDEALQVVELHADFDVVLLDVAMPGMNGLEGLTRLRKRLPSTPIVILSALEDSELVRDALARGAQGFIPKTSTGDVMLSALRLVFSGGIYLPPSLLSRCDSTPNGAARSVATARRQNDDGLGLTLRQRQVLTLIVQGKTNKEIARSLNMSETTVRTHATAIFRILNVSNRTQPGHIAAQRGFCGATTE